MAGRRAAPRPRPCRGRRRPWWPLTQQVPEDVRVLAVDRRLARRAARADQFAVVPDQCHLDQAARGALQDLADLLRDLFILQRLSPLAAQPRNDHARGGLGLAQHGGRLRRGGARSHHQVPLLHGYQLARIDPDEPGQEAPQQEQQQGDGQGRASVEQGGSPLLARTGALNAWSRKVERYGGCAYATDQAFAGMPAGPAWLDCDEGLPLSTPDD